MRTILSIGPDAGKLVRLSEQFLHLNEIEDQEEKERVWEEHQEHIESEFIKFQNYYPQVVLDETKDGETNGKAIITWLKEQGVAAEFDNLVQCIQDCYEYLVFDPAKAGLPQLGGPATGKILSNRADVSSAQWDSILSPHRNTETPDARLSAAEYKAKHPEGWSDIREREKQADIEFIAKQVQQFMAHRPQYIQSADNRQMLLDALQKVHEEINAHNLANAFDKLVQAGQMKTNEAIEIKLPGIRRVDFAGGQIDVVSAEKQAVLQWVKNHSSREIEARLLSDPGFRDILNS